MTSTDAVHTPTPRIAVAKPATPTCRSCRFASIGILDRILLGWRFAKCIHPSALIVDSDDARRYALVTGDPQKFSREDYTYCSCHRADYLSKQCGTEGRFWEPR